MSSLANISVRFRADLKQFSTQMQNASRQMQKHGKRFQKIGQNMSTYISAPIIAGAALVTKGTEELRSDLARLETNAESAGESIAFMRDQLKEVQAVTGETDSSVEGLSNLLAAGFKGESLTRALDNISGAAIKFSDTLKFEGVADGLQETLATGKAIGPFAELLERSGLNLENFDAGLAAAKSQGEELNFVLNTLASTGLEDINKRFRENNKDVTEARKAQLSFQLAMADLAKVVQPFITKAINLVTSLAERFNNLSPAIKKAAVIFGGIVAAVGPLLTGLGFLMTTVIPGLIAAFGALSAPILAVGAAIAGIAFVVVKYWDEIKREVLALANYFIDLYNESVIVRVGVENIVMQFQTLWEVGKLVFEGLKTAIKAWWGFTKNTLSLFGDAFKAIITGNFSDLPEILGRNVAKTKDVFKTMLSDIGSDIATFSSNMEENIQNSLDRIMQRKRLEINTTAKVDKVEVASEDSSTSTGQSGSGRAEISSASTLQSEGAMDVASLSGGLISDDQLTKMSSFNEKLLRMRETAKIVGSEVGNAFQGMSDRMIAGLDLAETGLQGFVKNIAATFMELIKMLLSNAIANAIAGATQSAVGTGPAAVFTQPAFIATAVGGVLSAFAAIPKFADGGIVSGPTMGLMGEYAGATNNPEVIAPLDKLKSMLGDGVGGVQTVKVEGILRGQNQILQNARAQNYRDRRG